MSYSKQGFHSGQILLAEHLISMEDGIISAVSFNAQELDETQKAQARRNIGITTDDTLTLEDIAADSKAVGIKFVQERNYTNNKITELVDNAPEDSNTLNKLASLMQKNTNELNTKINNINLESLGVTTSAENLNQIPDTITDIQSQVNNSISYTTQTLTDEQAIEIAALYPEWKPNFAYTVNTRLLYKEVLYKVLQDHTSQSDWTPDVAPSLFTKVLTSEDGTIYQWEQPDSTNPYMIGDKVFHNNANWISIVDNNVWEPGVYGWEVI